MCLHFAAFHVFPHDLHTVFYESFLHETVYPPAGSLVCVLVFDKVSSWHSDPAACKQGLSVQMLDQSTPAAQSQIYILEQFKEKCKLK